MENQENQISQKTNFVIPLAIIIAGMFIAGSLYVSNKGTIGGNNGEPQTNKDENKDEGEIKVKQVSLSDHIRGNPNAQVKVIEFSDTECPFCKQFHYTMNKIMEEYGKDGRVAWVYRHFPLDSIHTKARKEAYALECASEQGGDAKFWAYLDKIFEITPSNDGLDLSELPRIAEILGLNKVKFNECLNSGKFAKRVDDNLQDGVAAGARGTPYSVVITPSGKKSIISGVLSLDPAKAVEAMKAIIEQALAKK